MIHGANDARLRNLSIVALLIVVTLFTAFYEGYVSLISALFWVSLIAGSAISAWLAWTISTRRLLSLVLGILIIEYVKETMGIQSGLWTYHGIGGLYNFGVWAWVWGGLIAYALSTRIVIRQIRKLRFSPGRWMNPAIVTLIFLLVPLTLGDYRAGAGALFWSFYALLFIAGIYVSLRMDFPIFSGIVLTAWIVGNPSEYVGSVASGVWTYTHNPDYPPVFLVFAAWPLEILAQYSLSAFLANEPLDKDTLDKGAGL